MLQENNQKLKSLKLMEQLNMESDEQHPIKTHIICEHLAKLGISCDRRTLSRDINVLNANGYEIMSKMIGHEKAYYIEDRNFSIPELKILIDAIQAAKFITKNKTDELITKVAKLGGRYEAEILKGNMVCFNTHKHCNESIYYNVSTLEEALRVNKQASFYYFDIDENGEKVYRKEKRRYVVEPMALIYNEDYYYLMCYSTKYCGISNYRIDRMNHVEVENDSISKEAMLKENDVAKYTDQVFKMYGGKMETVTIEFDCSLIGAIYDKFGEDTRMIKTSENTCVTTVEVQISPTFWGWLFQFAGKMKILSPYLIKDEYQKQASLIIE